MKYYTKERIHLRVLLLVTTSFMQEIKGREPLLKQVKLLLNVCCYVSFQDNNWCWSTWWFLVLASFFFQFLFVLLFIYFFVCVISLILLFVHQCLCSCVFFCTYSGVRWHALPMCWLSSSLSLSHNFYCHQENVTCIYK